jgi:TonB family protein
MRLLPVLLTASALYAQDSADAHNWLNQGVAAFRSAQYPAAVEAFQKALQLDPNFTTARLYLATAYMQQFIPGATSPQNDEVAARALENFQGVLAQDPANVVAIASIGSLYLNQKKWDEAQQWYERLVALQPDNADAYYTLGFIEWSRWYPVYQQARASIGMKPEDAGPIPDIRTRQNLKVTYQAVVERGISDMQRALELRPDYSDAMSYMNLLIRERADLRDTADEYRRDIAEADQWVQKALVTKGMKAAGNATPGGLRINVNGNVQAAKLIRRVDPAYPPLALQARIQGTVKLRVTIAKKGMVQDIMVLSGHPLLVPAALEAVKQWVYQPTLMNGEPTAVVTELEVPFQLP